MIPTGTREPDPSTLPGTPEQADFLTQGRHPAIRDALQWLTYAHLPVTLQAYSRPFYLTAVELIRVIKDSPELTHTLTSLLQSKDWAVRAGIRTETGHAGSVPRPQAVVTPPLLREAG